MTPLDFSTQLIQQARPEQPESRAAEAGEAFEGYLVEMMVREMRKTVPEGLLSGSSMEMFAGMLDQEIAKRIAGSGGLGMGDVIARQVGGEAPPARLAPLTRRAPLHDHHGDACHGAERVSLRGARLPLRGRISSRFGHRTDPIHNKKRMHRGLDIAAPRGTDIQPIRGGTVVFAGERGGYGNTVIIDHGDGWRSLYAHCDRLDVKPGQRVGPDAVIGAVGSTGRSTGPHLHLEVHRDGEAVDPAGVLGL